MSPPCPAQPSQPAKTRPPPSAARGPAGHGHGTQPPPPRPRSKPLDRRQGCQCPHDVAWMAPAALPRIAIAGPCGASLVRAPPALPDTRVSVEARRWPKHQGPWGCRTCQGPHANMQAAHAQPPGQGPPQPAFFRRDHDPARGQPTQGPRPRGRVPLPGWPPSPGGRPWPGLEARRPCHPLPPCRPPWGPCHGRPPSSREDPCRPPPRVPGAHLGHAPRRPGRRLRCPGPRPQGAALPGAGSPGGARPAHRRRHWPAAGARWPGRAPRAAMARKRGRGSAPDCSRGTASPRAPCQAHLRWPAAGRHVAGCPGRPLIPPPAGPAAGGS
jgi:hypothetical protein